MPSCPVCGKEVQPEATFCPSCGSNLHASATSQSVNVQPQTFAPAQQRITISSEERLAIVVRRLERVSYVTAGAAVVLLITIVLLLI